jgi:hypothetical protein
VEEIEMNIFDEIHKRGHDEDFTPEPASIPTDDRPGSWVKISMMALRVDLGEELWHPEDRVDHVATVEDLEIAMKQCQMATMHSRNSTEFVARRAKMNMQNAG